MKTAKELWRYISQKGLKPLPKTSVSTWADSYRMLSAGISAEPGRWKTSRAPYQKEPMNAFSQVGVKQVVMMCASQLGKALAIDTPLPTPSGWKNMGDISVGDSLFDEDGNVCRVTFVTPIMTNHNCYEIEFSDGQTVTADEDHKWQVEIDKRSRSKGNYVDAVVKTTGELLYSYKNGNRNVYAVPVNGQLKLPEAELPIKPYTLGVWLSEAGLKNNKHIPAIYLRAGINQRWALLQGLMDTDGCCMKNGHCEITLKSRRLISDVSELLYSLGIKHTVKSKVAKCSNSPNGYEGAVWRLSFTAYDDMPIFRLKRKQERLKPRTEGRPSETFRRRIVRIEKVPSVPVRCITVNSNSHLYLAGRAMIPTHNTDIMLNVIGRFAHLDPCAIMMIQPSIDMAQDISKSRISPMIRDTTVLTGLFSDSDVAKTRNGSNTILSKMFPGGRLIMCGANSPAGLASRPIRILLADEVDRFPDSAGGEGNPVDLAAKRMTTFWNAVMGLFSTPTLKGRRGGIESKYIAGTQEEWQHKCPNCGEFHLLKWRNMDVDFEEKVDQYKNKTFIVHSVKWRCPECGFAFSDKEMQAAEQKYIVNNPDAINNGVRSFHVNCFASPWLKWKDVALEWLEAKGDPSKEQVVVNTRFAESYEPRGAFADEQVFMKRRELYDSELPDGVLLLTASVDTQDNRFEYEICGWGMEEECWGIMKGVILGRPDNARTFNLLDEVLDREFTLPDGTPLKVARTFIDSGGHYTGNIYKYCERNINKQRFAIKGQGGAGIPLNYKIAKATGSPVPLVILGVDDGKQQVMNRLSIDNPGPKYFHYPSDDTRGYDQIYFKGIISEQKKTVKRNGQIREIWEPVKVNGETVRNEPLDLRVYNLAAMLSLKPNWSRLYDAVHLVGEPQAEPAPKQRRKLRRSTSSFTGGDIW